MMNETTKDIKMNFCSMLNLTNELRTMTKKDYVTIIQENGMEVPEKKTEQEYLAKYLKQGLAMGKTGKDLQSYALAGMNKLFGILPHLTKENIMEAVKTEVVEKKEKPAKKDKPVKAKVEKAEKVAKAAKPAKAVKATTDKVKYADYSIVFNAKRNGYDGFVNGKAEAFRPTVEKVKAFFQKKYNTEGTVIETTK